MTEFLASLVLAIHLLIAVLVTAGLILVPVGARHGWSWVRSRRLRILHVTLMCFVALEAILGLTCPLTVLEYALREGKAPEYFLATLLQQVLYWDFPPSFFLVAYTGSAIWVLFLWWKVPPSPS